MPAAGALPLSPSNLTRVQTRMVDRTRRGAPAWPSGGGASEFDHKKKEKIELDQEVVHVIYMGVTVRA
jgi:hypothetical protein